MHLDLYPYAHAWCVAVATSCSGTITFDLFGPVQDEGAIRRLQEAIQKLQADVDKLKESMETVIDENSQRVKEIQVIHLAVSDLTG
ncbi:hypothetical protein ElyMa_001092100 [Elysia marginata]|uniref:Uncharacterized protein n=1 Tax=Elysia marginata TaxID=1093978 RepID=A0AAV4HU18_9GAST|nr:hypothetical protein ElyMa_001092100 [Elysia marginata]